MFFSENFTLKKFFCLLMISFSVFLSGCKNFQSRNNDEIKINTEITCNMSVYREGGQKYLCEFSNDAQRITIVKFKFPENLNGLILSNTPEKCEIFYNGMKCESNKNFFTENSIFRKIPCIINSFNDDDNNSKKILDNKSDDDNLCVYYQNKFENCEIYINNDGLLNKIFMLNDKVTVDFL